MPRLDHFSLIAPIYDRAIPVRNIERLIEFADLPVVGEVLDAGGGTGRVSHAIQNYVSNIIVADISARMLQQARTKNLLLPVQSVVEKLAFADESFERVIMIDALHHVINQQETADELLRVLKPGGRIVIEEPDIRRTVVKLVALAEKVLLMRSHFLSPVMIQSLFVYPNVMSRVEEDGFNAWVIIDKFGN